ncbi:MAG: LolA-like outer membrane lipoprotein chaperone [Helicobacteraceae bacterium]|nr:LolA-like outer membrane lipoprotein chaperone [Helicobacteraceae bacterium]
MKIILFFILSCSTLFGINLESIEAKFTQNINNSDGDITYSGILLATTKPSNKAYWKYDNPFKKEILIKNNQVTFYEPHLNQAIISNNIKLDFINIINSAEEGENGLISKINDIIFHIELKDNKPYKITYKDELDNDITIILDNIKINHKINDNMFKINMSQDTDIIYE